jgi:hypothetical protein
MLIAVYDCHLIKKNYNAIVSLYGYVTMLSHSEFRYSRQVGGYRVCVSCLFSKTLCISFNGRLWWTCELNFSSGAVNKEDYHKKCARNYMDSCIFVVPFICSIHSFIGSFILLSSKEGN